MVGYSPQEDEQAYRYCDILYFVNRFSLINYVA
jgi:hypothetical protein